jgi:predicted Zn-dependent protease
MKYSVTHIINNTIAQFVITAFLSLSGGCATIGGDATQVQSDQELKARRAIIVNHLNAGQPNRAINELRPLMIDQPDNADLLSLHGLSLLALSKPADAIAPLKKAYKLSPNATTALNLSSAYIETQKFKEATQVLLKLRQDSPMFRKYPFPERVHHNLGLSLEKQSKNKLAETQYKLAIKANPSFYLSLMQLGILYRKTQRSQLAVTQFNLAKDSCPNCFEPIEGLALAYRDLKKTQSANRGLEQYVQRRDVDEVSRKRAMALMQDFTTSRE